MVAICLKCGAEDDYAIEENGDLSCNKCGSDKIEFYEDEEV